MVNQNAENSNIPKPLVYLALLKCLLFLKPEGPGAEKK